MWAFGLGPFYVMMAPTEVLQTTQQRVIMPRLATPAKADGEGRASRDDRRRATHNEGQMTGSISFGFFDITSFQCLNLVAVHALAVLGS